MMFSPNTTSFATLGFFQKTRAKNLLMKEPLSPRGSNENTSNVRFLPEKLIIGILTASGRLLPLQSAAYETPLLAHSEMLQDTEV